MRFLQSLCPLLLVLLLTTQTSCAPAQDAAGQEGDTNPSGAVLFRSVYKPGQKLREVKIQEIRATELLWDGREVTAIIQLEEQIDWKVIRVEPNGNAVIHKQSAGGAYRSWSESAGEKTPEIVEDVGQDPKDDSPLAGPHLSRLRQTKGMVAELTISPRNQTVDMRSVGGEYVPTPSDLETLAQRLAAMQQTEKLFCWPENAVTPGEEWMVELSDPEQPVGVTRARWTYVGRETVEGRAKDELKMVLEGPGGDTLGETNFFYSPEQQHLQMAVVTRKPVPGGQIREICIYFDVTGAEEAAESEPSSEPTTRNLEEDFSEYTREVVQRSQLVKEFLQPRASARLGRWRAAAESGTATGQVLYGLCLCSGVGTDVNPEEGVKWFRRAAEQGHPEGQFWLGSAHHFGWVGEVDLQAAVEWYRKAAEQGSAHAQNSLGDFYYRAEGGNRDFTKAAGWFRKGAERQNCNAQYNLALCYLQGTGVRADMAEAMKWFKKAAEQGDADAQYYYGKELMQGEDVDLVAISEAISWLKKAADQGHEAAKDYLAELARGTVNPPPNGPVYKTPPKVLVPYDKGYREREYQREQDKKFERQ